MSGTFSSTPFWRLRGEIDGEPRTFAVDPGPQVVGNGPDCGVALTVRGVSRRHARLTAGPDGIRVEDLGSKNGTYVDGDPETPRTAQAGSEIRFGPVRLQVETVDPDDGQVGLALDTSSIYGPAEEPSQLDASTWLTDAGEERRGAPPGLLDAAVDRLVSSPEPDVDSALALLAAGLGALGVAVIDWTESNGVVAGAAGTVAAVPALRQLRRARGRRSTSGLTLQLTDAGPPARVAVALTDDAATEGYGVVAWFDVAPPPGAVDLLMPVLRLWCHLRPRTLATDLGPPTDLTEELPLPAGIVRGRAPSMSALYQQIKLLRQGDVPVLILGETGVGKEHLARTLHASSARSEGPYVAVNCAAIPGELLEAEMFGIGKGVATGVQPRRGKFAEADGGTLFLDEIGDMPAELQAKLLRALQEKTIHPLGRAAEPVDVRVVSATNTDLQQRMDDGHFRRDLYYRLAGYVLEAPPLRRRSDDVPLLVGHFLRTFCRETGKVVRGVTVKALRRLATYPWPGNVRELEHEVRRLVYLCPAGQAIDSEMLSPHVLRPEIEIDDPEDRVVDLEGGGLEVQLEGLERRLLSHALERTAGNQSRAARLLGISRNGLANRLKRLGIQAADFVV
ncbi:MAG: sigma 54-interacting transcriptional regulator [Acidobacteriota bacterium]